MFIVDTWRVVMDVKYNPLRHIPDPSLQTYFMLVLFTIWSVAFGLIAIFWLGFIGYNIMTSIIVHLSILIPLAFTNAVFVDAERDGEISDECDPYEDAVNNRCGIHGVTTFTIDSAVYGCEPRRA